MYKKYIYHFYYVFFHTQLCLYIYLYIYLLTYWLKAVTVTGKKKMPEFRDKNISWITVQGKKKKVIGKKKRKANLVTPFEKIQEIRNQLVKRKKTTIKCCEATITKSAQY